MGANNWQSADGRLEVCPWFVEPVVDTHFLIAARLDAAD